jgi:diguanylate cyclase (GGDEF)-like protein/PAS domain S-box-containing protein
MPTANKYLSDFHRNLWMTAGVFAVFVLTFALYVRAEKQIDHANDLRHVSLQLADELRQSSDDLTRMVRTYIATGDPIYKQHYQEILDIRDGKKPRPTEYHNVYWDLVLADNQRPRPFGKSIPLLKLMHQAGFTDEEFSKLAEAKFNSDELTRTEFNAMRLIGSADKPTRANREKAMAMLRDASYHQAKARIMRPIAEFNQMSNERTARAVHSAENMALLMRYILVFLGALLAYMLFRAYRSLHLTLGATVDALHEHISHLGSGDFSIPIVVAEDQKDSVLGWLAEMKTRIQESDTRRNIAEIDARAKDEKLRSLYEMAPVGIALTNMQGKYLEFNDAFERICGYTHNELNELDYWALTPKEYATQEAEQLESLTNTGSYGPYEKEYIRKDGNRIPLRLNGVLIHDGNGQPCIWSIVEDITDRKRMEDALQLQAQTDALTGLPNRTLAKDHFERATSFAKREHTKVALIFLDLDNFKSINDTLGHLVGDELLKAVAVRLKECVRDTDTLNRQGGDEFMIVLDGVPDLDAMSRVAEKILAYLAKPFHIGGNELVTSLSMGIAVYPEDGQDYDTLFKKADTAMYQAKGAGRNTYRFYSEQMNVDALENLRMRNGLRQALERTEFVLHYQPQIDLITGAVIGAEALIRWNHPELGMVPPMRFIPVAEESGIIVQIGDWVLLEACRQAVAWREAGLPEMVVAVNISAVQFRHHNLENSVIQALVDSGLNPACLELELTESIMIHDAESVLASVQRLKALGVKLSIDDFGTGYSSLSYLKRFNVDKLKIDQSFVRDMADDPNDAAIVRAIIQMARSLNLKTIAEGVEDERTLSLLRLQHCDEAQGYHFSRPVLTNEFVKYVTSRIG